MVNGAPPERLEIAVVGAGIVGLALARELIRREPAARIAGLDHSGVICEIMNDDGTMARIPQLREFCRLHGLKLVTVADLIRYRMQHERYVRRIAESVLPTRHGDFRMIAYSSDVDHELHVALVRGDVAGAERAVTEMGGEREALIDD